ncbi:MULTISPECIES: CGNR zinc finger domain-containing protein [Nocardia]|uniref:CGNR zinc finger domain-containing protein n=1 Tax=Nocardia TaxID=1817 RepID=UPI003556D346
MDEGTELDDLDLVVELVNTVYVCSSPPDRLVDVEYFRAILRSAGEVALAEELHDTDLPQLRWLRYRLGSVFGAVDAADAAGRVNTLLRGLGVVPQLRVESDEALSLSWELPAPGFGALAGRMAGALAVHIAEHGVQRLGVCAAAPCRCVFVDRSRPGKRKYCRDSCNDRMSAAAYYNRRRASSSRTENWIPAVNPSDPGRPSVEKPVEPSRAAGTAEG